jgi:hypothetical protein
VINVRLDDDLRGGQAAHTRFEGVAQQVAERLSQQHVVSLNDSELAAHVHVTAKRSRVGANLVGSPFADRAQIDAGQFPAYVNIRTCPRCPHFFLCGTVADGTLTLA